MTRAVRLASMGWRLGGRLHHRHLSRHATDIRNAGGTRVDQEVHGCTSGPNVVVSSRRPDDLPAFCAEMVEVFQSEGRPPARA